MSRIRPTEQHNSQVSVIMSVFNGAEFLRSAVESILSQTVADLELIVVNDGSTDRTRETLDSIRDERLRVVNQQNCGLPKALNRGIELARGRYIARMDADDIALPNRLEIQLAYMESHPEIDVLGGQARVIDESGRETGRIRKPVSLEAINRYLNYTCPLIHPTYMVKSAVYRQLGGYRDFVAVEDFDFLLRAHEAGLRLGNVPEDVLLYRRNSAGISARNAKRQMRGTRLILALHRCRAAGRSEPAHILGKLVSRDDGSSRWFEYWWRKRNDALICKQGLSGVERRLSSLAIMAMSLMHYELLLATYRGWRSLRWKQ